MSSGVVMWLVGLLICAGVFLNGLRFSKMENNPWTEKKLFGQPVKGAELNMKDVRRFGIMQMIFAPLFFVFWSLMLFGALGPVEGIETINLK